MTNIQTTRRTWRSQVWVVKQEKGEAETNPGPPSRHSRAPGRMCGRIHLDSLTTIVGRCGAVKGMPGASCRNPRGGIGTGARGAPVPEVGLYVKIKRAPFRSLGSRLNEGHVSSPGWLNRRQKTDRTGRPARGGQ